MKRKAFYSVLLAVLLMVTIAAAEMVPTAAISSYPTPLYVKPASKSAGVSMDAGQYCLIVDQETLGGNTWYQVVFLDDKDQFISGFAEGTLVRQMALSEIIGALSDSRSAVILGKLSNYEVPNKGEVVVTRSSAVEEAPAPEKHEYVLNKNSKKFHETWCDSADDIKPKNRKEFVGTREEVIQMGYQPCKRCNP